MTRFRAHKFRLQYRWLQVRNDPGLPIGVCFDQAGWRFEMNLTDLSWRAVDELDRRTPVVIPVAALEQHGHRLAVFTDSMLLGGIVRRVAERIGGRLLIAPLLWLGNSDHHLEFCGTLSAPPRVYLDMLEGVAENFVHHGFRRIVFFNGHGGNDVPGRQAIFELRQRHRQRDDVLFLLATYWALDRAPRFAGLCSKRNGPCLRMGNVNDAPPGAASRR